MAHILTFAQSEALTQAQTGGKGVNLARMTQAGFQVPPGFVVTTDAYSNFMAAGGLEDRVAALTTRLTYDNPAALEQQSAAIREAIMGAPVPAGLAGEIAQAYAALGDGLHVAVRSSGTAEDLADASFAGQHDTYLDIQGADGVVDAVKRCWASLWTARAAIYRNSRGFDHAQVRIAVVVQKMVRSDVSGVMFTANPLTTATDEIVINATWGLGESLVSGVVTPDTYVLHAPTGALIEQTVGEKEIRIVRDPVGGRGVVEEKVEPAEQAKLCLDTAGLSQLVRLAAKVQAYYGGFPQDIEWGMEGGVLYLLQSRPITGVEFSWCADVDAANSQVARADTVWTRSFGDALASGVVTPLTYSTRFPIFSGRNMRRMWRIFGQEDLAETAAFKYWKGELYYNAEVERAFIERLVPPQMRAMLLDFVPPVQHDEIVAAPFDEARFLKALLGWQMGDNQDAPLNLPAAFEAWRARTDYEGLTYAQLRGLSDEEVIAYCEEMSEIFGEWNDLMWAPFLVTLRIAMSALRWMVSDWYDGGEAQATFAKLVAGATQRTDTQVENNYISGLTTEIRKSPALRAALEAHEGQAFFDNLATFEEGRAFLARYETWIAAWGHRGHADRDYIYPRRSEDPAIDVRAFRLLLNAGEPKDDHAAEKAMTAARNAALAEVLENVAAKPGGPRRAEILKAVHTLVHKYLVIRDNERARPTDVLTFSRKRGYVELGRRLYERGQIGQERDFHFLSELELFQLVRGQCANTDLLEKKIRGRELACDRMLKKQANMPMHLQRNRPVDLEHAAQDGADGVFQGAPTSPGVVTGTARVIMDHSDMGRVNRGEILITHSTDPGWNPVFGIINAVVVETGGMLSHASCLAREYGFPAVHLPHAASLIPDGATVTIDGHTGKITIVDPTGASPQPAMAGE